MSEEQLGSECMLYRNTGTYGTPVWVLIENVKDLTLNVDYDEVDVTTRASGGWKETAAGLANGSVDFSMIYDLSDAQFVALQTAFYEKTAIEFAIMDSDIEVAGAEGLRATCKLFQFPRNEPLADVATNDVTIKPTRADNPPSWYTVSA